MPSKQTQNYKLSQWERSDKVLMDDFNADNLAIDAAIKAVDVKADGLAASKAERSELSALQTVVSGKGNCRIDTQSYTGDGTYGGAKTPNSLSFPAKPEIVFIGAKNGNGNYFMLAFYGQTLAYAQSSTTAYVNISWTGNTMTWYCNADAAGQLNSQGIEYFVLALIAES